MSGFNEMSAFGDHWRYSENFNHEPVGNYLFRALINYTSIKHGVILQECTVRFIRNGYQDGQIDIFDNGNLQSEEHHLTFNEKWQKYTFEEQSGTFEISSSSPKMGGAYTVLIQPNGAYPSI